VIDRIEKDIEGAAVCLAEITTNNANVWFELGYALACKKPVVMIREKNARTKFPFDVQHRSILQYDTESSKDYEELKTKIAERLKAVEKTQAVVEQLPPEGTPNDL
jgi:nucleoside 2-deoxyribosyltransferase